MWLMVLSHGPLSNWLALTEIGKSSFSLIHWVSYWGQRVGEKWDSIQFPFGWLISLGQSSLDSRFTVFSYGYSANRCIIVDDKIHENNFLPDLALPTAPSAAVSLLLSVLLFALLQIFKADIASKEYFTIAGGFVGSLLFITLLTVSFLTHLLVCTCDTFLFNFFQQLSQSGLL